MDHKTTGTTTKRLADRPLCIESTEDGGLLKWIVRVKIQAKGHKKTWVPETG